MMIILPHENETRLYRAFVRDFAIPYYLSIILEVPKSFYTHIS